MAEWNSTRKETPCEILYHTFNEQRRELKRNLKESQEGIEERKNKRNVTFQRREDETLSRASIDVHVYKRRIKCATVRRRENGTELVIVKGEREIPCRMLDITLLTRPLTKLAANEQISPFRRDTPRLINVSRLYLAKFSTSFQT